MGSSTIKSSRDVLGHNPDVDRRSFMMRSAVIGAAAVMTGTTWTPDARALQAL